MYRRRSGQRRLNRPGPGEVAEVTSPVDQPGDRTAPRFRPQLARSLCLVALIGVAACTQQDDGPKATGPTTTRSDKTLTIRLIDFSNHVYHLRRDGSPVKAINGNVQWEEDAGSYSGRVVSTHFGDLNGDGVEEASVFVQWDFLDGTGRFRMYSYFALSGTMLLKSTPLELVIVATAGSSQ